MLAADPDPAAVPDTLAGADLSQIQTLVFRGGARDFPWSSFLFVSLPSEVAAARAWLREVAAELAWHGRPRPTLRVEGGELVGRVQLALTTRGLRRLGLDRAVIGRFPFEAKAGMERRARVLGDPVDDPHAGDPLETLEQFEANKPLPTDWAGTGGVDLRSCDAVLLLFATSAPDRHALDLAQRDRLRRAGGTTLTSEYSAEWKEREPFGFADGLSQPAVRGQPTRATPSPENELAAGEILLGYRNEYHQVPKSPRFDLDHPTHGGFDVGKDGTFLVFRKLEQDVLAFWRTFAALGQRFAGQAVGDGYTVPADPFAATHWLAARAMGRWTNGNSTLTHPHAAGDRLPPTTINDFVYGADPHGLACPIGSHVRRANPRDQRGGPTGESWKVVKRHRILRRGRAYGHLHDADTLIRLLLAGEPVEERPASGLLFVCLQSNITRGFEFVQQIWNNNPGFHGVYQEADAIAGPGGCRYSIPARTVRLRLDNPFPDPAEPDEDRRLGLPRFVVPRGGGYFFVPSRATVELLTAAA